MYPGADGLLARRYGTGSLSVRPSMRCDSYLGSLECSEPAQLAVVGADDISFRYATTVIQCSRNVSKMQGVNDDLNYCKS